MLSRAEFKSFQNQVFILACQIGLNPAAHAFNLNPDRVRKWAQRQKWNITAINPMVHTHRNDADKALMSRGVTGAREAITKVMEQYADRSRLAMANVGNRAFEYAQTLKDEELHERDRAIALQNHGKNLQLAHQWFPNALSSNVAVQVNVPMPTEEERAEMRAMDRKLDAIAAKLKANPTLESK